MNDAMGVAFKFTPNQLACLEALESGEYTQTTGKLRVKDSFSHVKSLSRGLLERIVWGFTVTVRTMIMRILLQRLRLLLKNGWV
jgi:hypothetical protein